MYCIVCGFGIFNADDWSQNFIRNLDEVNNIFGNVTILCDDHNDGFAHVADILICEWIPSSAVK